MKKTFIILIIFLFAFELKAQINIAGKYQSKWGSSINLNSNNTFNYESFECYHLVTAKGQWKYNNDTIILNSSNKAGFDSIVRIIYDSLNSNSIRITITDLYGFKDEYLPVMLYVKGKKTLVHTDTLGLIEFPNSGIDSISIGSKIIVLDKNRENKNQIKIVFLNINISDTENFDNRVFLLKRRRLYEIYNGKIDETRYFRKN